MISNRLILARTKTLSLLPKQAGIDVSLDKYYNFIVNCAKHGRETRNSVKGKKYFCSKCGREANDANRRTIVKKRWGNAAEVTLKKYLKKMFELGFGNEVSLVREIGSYNPRRFQFSCTKHGLFVQEGNFIRDNGGCPCPKCGQERDDLRNLTKREQTFQKTWEEKLRFNNKLVHLVSIVNGEANFICSLHGTFTRKCAWYHPKSVICSQCGKLKKIESRLISTGISIADFKKKSIRLHRGQYTYEKLEAPAMRFSENSDLLFRASRVIVTCKEHGDVETLVHIHMNGHGGCMKCLNKWWISKPHKKLSAWLTHLGFRVKDNYRFEDCWHSRELDIYLPEVKIGIEVNGVYWHSIKTNSSPIAVQKHALKTEECNKLGIRLLQFWDTEIAGKPRIVGSILRHALGRTRHRIGARQCRVEKVSTVEQRFFLNENHLQGYTACTSAYGLYLKDELVAMLTIGKPRFNKKYDWELLRFAVKCNWAVSGGFSKLLKEASRGHSGKLITYADKRYSQGNLYSSNGFKFLHDTSPNYVYVDPNGFTVSRISAQKHKLSTLLGKDFDPDLTEGENMKKAKFFPLYDCGNSAWELKLGVVRDPAFGSATSDHLITYG